MGKKKIHEFLNKPAPVSADMFLLEDSTTGIYYNVTQAQLLALIASGVTLQQVLTNGNSTGGLAITSPDGTVSFLIHNGEIHSIVTNGTSYSNFISNIYNNTLAYSDGTISAQINQNNASNSFSHDVKNFLNSPLNEVSQDPTTALGIATRQFVLANVPSVPVTSVFGRTGTVIAVSGDYTTAFVTETTNLYYTQTRFDTAFTAKSTTNLTEGTNLYFTNPRSIASTLTSYVSGAGAVSSADSIISAIQKLNGNIALVSGAIVYKGLWNASTNTPTLVSGVGTKGIMYKVSVAGTTTIDGISQWSVGDQIMFDGTTWDKLDGIATEVLSVNGAVGAVTLTTANVSEVTNLYFTTARAITALTGQSNALFTNGAGYLVANQTITLSGDVTGSGTIAITTAISNTVVTGKLITGYVSGAGVISATDSILSAINKLNGNTAILVANNTGTNTGDNATNTQYANDYRLANFVAGTNYLAPNGSAAALTSFPTLNQSTTGNASTATNLTGLTTSVVTLNNTSNTNTGDVAVATTTDIITGTDNVKTISALGLANSSFLNQAQAKIYAVATGTDTYAITLTPAITVLTAGLTINVLFTNANTTAITINVNALGAKAVTKDNISALVLGDIKAGVIYTMTYDGTRFQCDCGEAFLNSPTFTGIPAAPTATVGTNTTQLATTAFVLANSSTTTLTSTQVAFGSAGNAITSSSNFVVNTTTGFLSAPLVINVGGIPSGGYDVFNHFQMPMQIAAFKSTTAGNPSELQVYNNINVLQFGVEGSINSNRMGGTLAYNMYFGCYYNYGLTFHTNNLARGYISAGGNWFFGGNTTGTAVVHIKAGSATANTAPLKLTSGVNLTVLENGAFEYDGINLTLTALGTRQTVHKGLNGSFSGTGTATTDFIITFGGTQPNATYQVNITPSNALTAAVFYVTTKTTTTFKVSFLTGLTGTVAFDWVLTQ